MSNQNVTFDQMYAAIVALTESVKENTQSRNKAISKAEVLEQVAKTAEKVADAVKAESEDESKVEQPETENGISTELVEAALLEVKNKFGADAAKQIIKDIAGVARVKGIPEDKYQEVIDACEAKMNEPEQDNVEAEQGDTVTESEITIDDVKAVAKEFGKQSQAHLAKAKEIIKEVGKADKIADVAPENYAALIEALQNATLNEDEDL